MIYYLVTSQHSYTVRHYLRSWSSGQELARTVQVVPYSALPGNLDMPGGAYVFSDLERLGPRQRELASGVWDRLAAAGDAVRLHNHPLRSLRRFELLSCLSERGQNRFRAHRPTAPGQPWRYPVFVRHEREHTGNLSSLLHSAEEVRVVLLKLILDGHDLSDLLVVELCDTADEEGIYRKYSAFRVGDRILPRHVLFSRQWMQKDLDLLEPAHREEIRAYCRTNPHREQLLSLFELAGIDYGRIDYSVLDGQIQVWEINTNPIVVRPPDEYAAETLAFHDAFARLFGEALGALNVRTSPTARIPMGWQSVAVWGS